MKVTELKTMVLEAEKPYVDNNHFLCLDTTTPATSVAFPAGHLVDPNGDLNADSKVMVRR